MPAETNWTFFLKNNPFSLFSSTYRTSVQLLLQSGVWSRTTEKWPFYAWKHAVCHSGVRSWTHSYQKRVSNNGKRDRDEAATTRCKAKPVGSPPGYLPSWLFIIVNVGQLSAALALLVVRRHLTNRMRTQFCGPGPQHWLPRQRLLQKRKTNFTTFIYSHSSTNPENLGKIGLGDVEIIGATRSLKINTKQRQNVSPPSEQTWWL